MGWALATNTNKILIEISIICLRQYERLSLNDLRHFSFECFRFYGYKLACLIIEVNMNQHVSIFALQT